MAWGRIKTEHSGPKRGRGYHGRKAEAKAASKRVRRRNDRIATRAAGSQSVDLAPPRSD